MIRHLYSLLLMLLQPLLRLKLRQRGRQESGYLEHRGERWGDYRHLDAAEGVDPRAWNESSIAYRPTLWVHAVSLGETRAAAVLLAALRPRVPHLRLLLTHGTATGRAEGRALLRDGDLQLWLPWDTPMAVNRFLRRFRPELGVLIETEVWPNLVAACAERKLPLVLANARLSERSLHKALRVEWLARPAYAGLHAVYAQTHADAARLRELGSAVEDVFGNLKFDATVAPHLLAQGRAWRTAWDAHQAQARGVLMFASSREGEESLLLQAILALTPAQRASVQWLIVPRHPQRFDEVADLVRASGLSLSRRSAWSMEGPLAAEPAEVWLGDSLGEMPRYYAMSDLALLGGSFLPLGGQNLIEAAACACPVVMGPHTFNFAEAASNSAEAGAAFAVRDLDEAVETALAMLEKPDLMRQCRQATRNFVQLHQGAAARTAEALAKLV